MSSNLIRHAVLTAPHTIEILTRPQPRLEPGQVRLEVEQVGVCGSEVQHWSGETSEQIPSELGHEFSGFVIETAGDARNLGHGTRVVAWVPSGRAFADQAVVEARHCFAVRHDVPFPFAAEPLSCVWNAVNKAQVPDGAHTVFVGAGFMALLAAKIVSNPASMIVASRREQARAVAERWGASHAVDPMGLRGLVGQVTRNRGAQAVYEFTGVQAGLDQAASVVGPGGTLVIGGFHQGPAGNPQITLSPGQRVLDMERLNWMAVDIVNAALFTTEESVRAAEHAEQLVRRAIVDPNALSRLIRDPDQAVEVLAETVTVFERASAGNGAVTVVLGSGLGAMLAVLLARAEHDPRALILASRKPEARALAMRLGATHAVDPSMLTELVMEGTEGAGAGAVYEYTGVQEGLDLAMRNVRMSGKLVLATLHDGLASADGRWTLRAGQRVMDLGSLITMGVNIVNGHFRDEGVILSGMQQAVTLLNGGAVDPTPLIGLRFPLEQAAAAFRAAAGGAGKVVVTP